MSVRKLRLCVLTPVHSSTLMGGAEYQINCLLETLVPTDRYEIHYLAASASTDSQPHGYQIVPVETAVGCHGLGSSCTPNRCCGFSRSSARMSSINA
jgi:hypothetical protein